MTKRVPVAASRLLADSRVVQFWSSKRFTGNAFQEALGLERALPWDVVLVFPPGGPVARSRSRTRTRGFHAQLPG